MDSTSDWRDRPPEDLTARARIRDAALAQFAERGFKGATVKGIADVAGVSPGLLQHHFGSKDELRRTCDEYVVEAYGGLDALGIDSGEVTDPGFMSDLLAKNPLISRYVARSMVEGSPAASALFEAGAATSERFLGDRWPERFPAGSDRVRDAAAVMAAMHLSTMVLHEQISRRIGEDVLASRNAARIPMAMSDVYASVAEFTASQTGAGIREAVSDAVARQREEGPPASGAGTDSAEERGGDD